MERLCGALKLGWEMRTHFGLNFVMRSFQPFVDIAGSLDTVVNLVLKGWQMHKVELSKRVSMDHGCERRR